MRFSVSTAFVEINQGITLFPSDYENEPSCNIIIISESEDQDVYEEEENQEDASSIE